MAEAEDAATKSLVADPSRPMSHYALGLGAMRTDEDLAVRRARAGIGAVYENFGIAALRRRRRRDCDRSGEQRERGAKSEGLHDISFSSSQRPSRKTGCSNSFRQPDRYPASGTDCRAQ